MSAESFRKRFAVPVIALGLAASPIAESPKSVAAQVDHEPKVQCFDPNGVRSANLREVLLTGQSVTVGLKAPFIDFRNDTGETVDVFRKELIPDTEQYTDVYMFSVPHRNSEPLQNGIFIENARVVHVDQDGIRTEAVVNPNRDSETGAFGVDFDIECTNTEPR
jgi:hypothetical protein